MSRPRWAPVRHRRRRISERALAWLTLGRRLLAVVLVLAVSGATLAGYAAWHIGGELQAKSVQLAGPNTPAAINAFDGAFNVLLVGADNAPGQKGWGSSRDATLNDVNILVHVSANHQSAVVLSMPRDMEVDQPQCGDPDTGKITAAVTGQPLNTAYSRGGLACVVSTVQSLTGIDIPYAALFSFEGTVEMANAVGGVPVCLTAAVNDPDSGLVLPKGRSVVKGRTALAYLRSRHGVGDGSDLARIASQQAYMSSLLRTMTSGATLSDPTKLYGLAAAAAHSVTLSSSLANLETMVRMALAIKHVDLSRIVFVQYPTGEAPDNPNKLVPSTELATTLLEKITTDTPFSLASDSLGANAKLATGASKSATGATATRTTAAAVTKPSGVGQAAAGGAPSGVPAGALPSGAPGGALPSGVPGGARPSGAPPGGTVPSGAAPTGAAATRAATGATALGGTASSTAKTGSVLEGLRGQTAAQQTCSVAYYG